MKTDPKADPPYKGMTCFITEKEPWAEKNEGDFAGPRDPAEDQEDGLQGRRVDRARLQRLPLPARAHPRRRGRASAQGFKQMMDALEVGRVNVAARGVGIAQRALELALRYSQERKTFGKPIAQHQAIQFKLAEMATKVEAARLLTMKAARMKDAGERSDLEAGMAKLFASETGKEVVEECVPHPRRLRLLEGVRDRAPLPRRAAAADRRGHLRDPEDGDRQEGPRAEQDLSGRSRLAAPSRGIGREIATPARARSRLPRCSPGPATRRRSRPPTTSIALELDVDRRRQRRRRSRRRRGEPGIARRAGQQRRHLRSVERGRRLRPRRRPTR